jgi:hypothetical protein
MRFIVDKVVLVFYIAIRYIMPSDRKLRAFSAVYRIVLTLLLSTATGSQGLPETRSVRGKAHVGGTTWENIIWFGLLSC